MLDSDIDCFDRFSANISAVDFPCFGYKTQGLSVAPLNHVQISHSRRSACKLLRWENMLDLKLNLLCLLACDLSRRLKEPRLFGIHNINTLKLSGPQIVV